MKTYWGSGGIDPHILVFGTRWRRVVSFMPRPLYPQGKSPQYPLDKRLGGSQNHSGRGGEEKNSHSSSFVAPSLWKKMLFPAVRKVLLTPPTEVTGHVYATWMR